MARQLTEHNPANFTPSEAETETIAVRQEAVRVFCREMFEDQRFQLHANPSGRRAIGGVIYLVPIMLAKASMINKGQNLLTHWQYFQQEMGIPWDVRMWESDESQWSGIGTRMESELYRTDFSGTLLTAGRWTPVKVAGVHGFSIISEIEALRWLGVIGGQLPYIDHPMGTLITFPREASVVAGAAVRISPHTVFGKPPYALGAELMRPAWVTVDDAEQQLLATPGAAITAGEYTIPATVTDANGEVAKASYTVTVTAS